MQKTFNPQQEPDSIKELKTGLRLNSVHVKLEGLDINKRAVPRTRAEIDEELKNIGAYWKNRFYENLDHSLKNEIKRMEEIANKGGDLNDLQNNVYGYFSSALTIIELKEAEKALLEIAGENSQTGSNKKTLGEEQLKQLIEAMEQIKSDFKEIHQPLANGSTIDIIEKNAATGDEERPWEEKLKDFTADRNHSTILSEDEKLFTSGGISTAVAANHNDADVYILEQRILLEKALNVANAIRDVEPKLIEFLKWTVENVLRLAEHEKIMDRIQDLLAARSIVAPNSDYDIAYTMKNTLDYIRNDESQKAIQTRVGDNMPLMVALVSAIIDRYKVAIHLQDSLADVIEKLG